jgi:23S rRNA-/tRNA-specific pseudouridylate synthase
MTAQAPREFVHHPGDRFTAEEPEKPAGRAACTDFRILQCWKQHTLLEVRISTGRTHQIRVHLSAVGHPVAGDRLYGAAAVPADWPANMDRSSEQASLAGDSAGAGVGPAEQQGLRRPEPCATESPKRFYLHARCIRLAHPSTHAPLSIEAPLPPDFEQLLRSLGV